LDGICDTVAIMLHARLTPLAWFSASAFFCAVAAFATMPVACAGPEPCEINSDCIEGACIDGTCKRECADSERDCKPGFRCLSGQCLPDDTGGSGGMGSSSSGEVTSSSSSSSGDVSSSSSAVSSSSSSSSGASSSSSSGGGGTKGELDLCGADPECASPLLCRSMWKNGPSRCTRNCVTDGGCPSGMRCSAVGNEKFCTTSDIGKSCVNASACNFGCLEGPGYCTAACGSGSDCPNGFGCMAVGNPPTKVCVKASEYCEAQNTKACIVPAACDTNSLIVGACTLACSSNADCPQRASLMTPWTCSSGLCKRPADVHGPLGGGYTPTEYACDQFNNVVNLCNDAQHMNFQAFTIPNPPPVNCASPVTTAGSPGDACVDSCRYQGACPFGFGCTAVGNISGARIGLCLPTGAGEVGAACTNDTQCAFGYCSSQKCSRDCTADGVCPTGSTCVAVGGAVPNVEGMPFKRCQ